MTDEIVAFISACLKNEEKAARAVLWDGSGNSLDWDAPFSATLDTGGDTIHIGDRYVTAHIALHDPARVLREIEAKKAIVADYVETVRIRDKSRAIIDAAGDNPGTQDVAEERWTSIEADALRDVLRRLAAVYVDRDGWKEEWKP
jgi:hypothetical protein